VSNKKKDAQGSPVGIPVRLNMQNTDNIRSRYATNLVVQVTEYEVTLSFFEAQAPLLLGTPDENIESLSEIGSVPAECVSKVIISPRRLRDYVQAMQIGLEQYNAIVESQQEEKE
jgi:hypothetical protein